MPATYEPIASNVISSSTSSINFNSIPQTYTDLVLVINGQMASGGSQNVYLTFNSDTSTNYSSQVMYGTGSVAAAGRTANLNYGGYGGFSSSVICTNIYHINNYSNTTTFKPVLGRASVPNSIVDLRVSMWRSTSAISSITVGISGGYAYDAGTSFHLYGIKAA